PNSIYSRNLLLSTVNISFAIPVNCRNLYQMGYLTIVHYRLNVYNVPMIGLISCVHLNKAWEFLKHSPFQLEECIHSLYFGIQLIEVRQYSGGTLTPLRLLCTRN